jgi:hypothetical protein
MNPFFDSVRRMDGHEPIETVFALLSVGASAAD